MRIVTIGGYGFTEETFAHALHGSRVDCFVDIRQRRGLRGAKYAFLNSMHLQSLLASLRIRYVYARELAPTAGVREAQKESDHRSGATKRGRTQLSPTFIERYKAEILGSLDPEGLRKTLACGDVVVFFCVEGIPEACHRSIAAEHFQKIVGAGPVEHIRP